MHNITATTAQVKSWLVYEEFSGKAIRRLLHEAKLNGQQVVYGTFQSVPYPAIDREMWMRWDSQRRLFVWVQEIAR
jgi:hypothetical protein